MKSAIKNDRDTSALTPSIEGQIEALESRIEEQNCALRQRDEQILILKEKLAHFQRKFFAASSEKLDPGQLNLFDEAEVEADQLEPEKITDVAGHKRVSRGRPPLPEHLPRQEVIHDLPEDQKVCPHDGTPLKEIKPETSEHLDIIPAKVQVIVHVRKKYVCPCCEGHVATAAKPRQPLGKSWATAGLLAYIIVSKYVDALPLYRQSKRFARLGIDLNRTTMANWMIRSGQLVQALINRLTEHILEDQVVHMDETGVQVLDEPGRSADSRSYMWVLGSGPPGARTTVFHYAASRGASVAKALLNDYAGALMVDGYASYNWVTARGMTRLGCMAHARRPFAEICKSQPKGKAGKADWVLAKIARLYRIERAYQDATAQERCQARQTEAKPILDDIRVWLDKSLPRCNPENKLGKALTYLHNQWPHLIRYLDDGNYPIDNNAIENAIRPFAVGRRNWLFSKSTRGATASANLYSLVETAKGHGLEPYAYLRHVFEHLPNAATLEDIDALLPQNVVLN